MKTQAQNAFNRSRSRKDWLARHVMAASGWTVLLMFLLLIGHIFYNTLPLFQSPALKFQHAISLPKGFSNPNIMNLFFGKALIGQQACDIVIYDVNAQQPMSASLVKRFPFSCNAKAQVHQQGQTVYITAQKTSSIVEVYLLKILSNELALELVTSVSLADEMDLAKEHSSLEFSFEDELLVIRQQMLNEPTTATSTTESADTTLFWLYLDAPQNSHIQTVADAEQILVLAKWNQVIVANDNTLRMIDKSGQLLAMHKTERSIRSIMLGPNKKVLQVLDVENNLTRWVMQNKDGEFVFVKDPQAKHSLHSAIKTQIFDPNANAGLQFYTDGSYAFFNSVTSQVFTSNNIDHNANTAKWDNQQVYVFSESHIHSFEVINIQGITTFQSMFGKNLYAGYSEPVYAWQTSSADPHYQAKYSLVPLLIGSLKASLLALLVAIPLALGAAVYTSFFAMPGVKLYLKPCIEMLEAVPSVIIGFIAAVWLAPLAEQFLLSILIFIVLIPFALILGAGVQPFLSSHLELRLAGNWEIFLIVTSSTLLAIFSFTLGELWQSYLIQMSVASPLHEFLSIPKTTIVVAVALGVAIAPTIYSLADDALSEVPQNLIKASAALGASRLQTLRRIVIAVALPSLISAVMLGFGRAFGETMIVLMVSGNTPISDWNIFEGLRSLTANLAIELQEANTNSAHFNLLFFTAAILFMFTFILNTAAELLRKRLRKVVGNVKD